MDKQTLIENYKHQFPSLFSKMLMLWKDSPSHNNWVLEKVMEVFCRDIASDTKLVKATGFDSFLNGFLEGDNLVCYPDFVMNNVALMAAEVLLSSEDAGDMEKPAFKIIRGPLEYGLVTKGHRSDVTFQILKKFVEQRCRFHLLDSVDFDASQAFAYCLASPQNYTRKSSSEYLVELVKMSFDNNAMENLTKAKLRHTVFQLIHQYKEHFTEWFIDKKHHGPEKFNKFQNVLHSEFDLSAVANYCKLLGDFSEASEGWNQEYSQTDMFDAIIMLLKATALDNGLDFGDLYRVCTQMLLKFVDSCNEEVKTLRFKKLRELLSCLCDTKNYNLLCDVIYMAGRILSGITCSSEDNRLLFELSLLPLYTIFYVNPDHALSTFPSVLETVHSYLEKEQKSKPSQLLKEAVSNLALLVEQKLVPSCCSEFIDYLILNRLDPPSEVGSPLLSGDCIRNEGLLNYLILELSHVMQAPADDTEISRLRCIQVYCKACLSHATISQMQLSVVLKCYVATIQSTLTLNSQSLDGDEQLINEGIFQDILFKIQLKMVDVNPNVRELAVETLGDLTVLGCPKLANFLKNQDCLPSLWQCVEDKVEGVVTKVLEFLWKAAEAEKLDEILALMNVTKDVVESRIQELLLSSQWDNIKPVGFKILTKINTDGMLVRYAETCLGQSNSQEAQAVLEYVHILFSIAEDENLSLEHRVERIITLLTEGWGDLVLNKANATDVCSFRKATVVMEELVKFMESPAVSELLDAKLTDFMTRIETGRTGHSQGVHDKFTTVCEAILKIHGHESLQSKSFNGCAGSLAIDSCSSPEISKVSKSETKRKGHSDCREGSCTSSAKMRKLETEVTEGGVHNLISADLCGRCFLCSLIDNQSSEKEKNDLDQHNVERNVQDKPTSSTNFEVLLNSTEELPALTLKTEPFPSQKMVKNLLLNTTDNQDTSLSSTSTRLTTWFVLKNVLQMIDPQRLKEDAQSSTDEYERNSDAVLHDLDKVLDRSLNLATKELEKELMVVFISSFAGLMEPVTKTSGSSLKEKLFRDTVLFVHQVCQVLDREEQIIAFILRNRRSVLDNDNLHTSLFTLEKFKERMTHLKRHGACGLKVKEYFYSPEGLKVLLDVFCKGDLGSLSSTDPQNKLFISTDSVFGNQGRFETQVTLSQKSKQETLGKITLTLQKACESFCQEEISRALLNLQAEEITDMSHTFSIDIETQETLENSLKTLIKSERRAVEPVLKFLLKLAKSYFVMVFEKNERSQEKMLSVLNVLFCGLKDWCTSDDDGFDSEGDNDPAALDCF